MVLGHFFTFFFFGVGIRINGKYFFLLLEVILDLGC